MAIIILFFFTSLILKFSTLPGIDIKLMAHSYQLYLSFPNINGLLELSVFQASAMIKQKSP